MFDFYKNGNAIVGIHKTTLSDYHKHFVSDFKKSYTRPRNWDSLTKNVLPHLISIYDKIEYIWIDGSFNTKKLDPNDIDLVVFVDINISNPSEYNDYLAFKRMIDGNREYYRSIFCDLYCHLSEESIRRCQNSPSLVIKQTGEVLSKITNSWVELFGTDRESRPKGIYEIKLGEND